MFQILFVHGTGVRRVSFDKTLALIRAGAQEHLSGTLVHGCLWGEPKGAKLRLGGRSIPTYSDQPAEEISEREAEEIELTTWRMLREDPLFELRLLENLPRDPHRGEAGPLDATPGEES